MSLLPPKIRGSFIVTLILAVACFCSYADAAKAKTKKKAKPKVEKPKTAQVDTNKVIIEANDPKAFTKAILLDKKGVDFEVVGEQKNKSPQLVVKEKKSEDFFDFSTMLIPITHKAPLGSRYGVRDHRLHRGVDVSIIRDEPVVAAFPGTVVVSKYNQGGYGHYVLVEHENGLSTLYGHLSERLVKVGEKVYPGDIVGLAGNTGKSSGAHLHFEIRYGEINIDPETIVDFPNWELKPGVEHVPKKKIINAHYNMQRKLKKENHYTVRKGDTQGKVAAWFNISIDALCRLNNLKPGAPLKVGQTLIGSR
jgi:murein DD-endopeptidase MepM/ murein hydrolase activator NlpD